MIDKKNDDGVLKTFDMYSHLSRPTVILAIVFIVLAVLVMLFGFLTAGHVV